MNIIKILEVSILRAQARLQSLNACRKVKSEYKLHQAVGSVSLISDQPATHTSSNCNGLSHHLFATRFLCFGKLLTMALPQIYTNPRFTREPYIHSPDLHNSFSHIDSKKLKFTQPNFLHKTQIYTKNFLQILLKLYQVNSIINPG